MKKVLFATTALVMTAGYAAAEVAVSGDGRMGVIFTTNSAGDNESNFTSRARVKFTLTGETDTGLSFGGSFRVNDENGIDSSDDERPDGLASKGGAGSVFVSGSFGKLTMGDVDSAAENASGDLYAISLTGLGDRNELNYLASDSDYNDNPGALYEYSFGSATVYASMYDGSPEYVPGVTDEPTTPQDETVVEKGTLKGDAWSVGGKYSTDTFTVGLGYEDSDDADMNRWTISGEGKFAGVGLKAIYAAQDNGTDSSGVDRDDLNEYGLSGKYTISSVEVAAFWRRQDFSSANTDNIDHYGLGASYDLGGGAKVMGGITDSNLPNSDPAVDMGISFSF